MNGYYGRKTKREVRNELILVIAVALPGLLVLFFKFT